jgi:hypothetical protein
MECINRKKVLMTERKLQSTLYQDLAEKKKLKRIFPDFSNYCGSNNSSVGKIIDLMVINKNILHAFRNEQFNDAKNLFTQFWACKLSIF